MGDRTAKWQSRGKDGKEALRRQSALVRDDRLQNGMTCLRYLDEAAFAARYATDRFAATIMANRMRYIVKHMSTVLLTTSFSMILREWYDFAATISGPPHLNYPMCTSSDSLSIFTFTMGDGVRNIVEEFGVDNIRPGDVLIANDPYRIGLHVNDVCFVRPVFYRSKLMAFVTVRAHQLDMGGTVAGGFSGTKHNVYETGLVIPPILLYRDDKPQRPTFNLIFDNARFGDLILPDIKSLYQSLLLGERLLIETIDKYEEDAFLGAINYSCDVSADAMRTAIAERIPDGIYEGEDALDCDGASAERECRLKVRIVKAGDRMEFDFSETSRQAPTSINCGPLDVKAAVGVAMKMLVEQEAPITSGCFRNINIVLPPGTFVSATPPHGPIFMYWEASFVIISAIYKALAGALGEDAVGPDFGSMMVHNGSGTWPDGSPWLSVSNCGGEHGPWSATKAGDGDSYNVNHTANNLDPSTEAIETDVPAVVLRKEYVTDSGGPGCYRGGAAVKRDTLWLQDGDHNTTALHTRSPAGVGVFGGQSGTAQACWMHPAGKRSLKENASCLLIDDAAFHDHCEPVAGIFNPVSKRADLNGEFFYFGSHPAWHLETGSGLRFQTGGGGGWGNPLDRDPAMVLHDVRDEYVSIEGAADDYGVVIRGDPQRHPEKLVIDHEATDTLRHKLRSEQQGKR
ncbi:MAG: hydantoinase B/oxoprolinase family protein [Novosphingobium sp.]|nr:hydantoinase B/oxoprolinase family protein [Novosphingobium sp.]